MIKYTAVIPILIFGLFLGCASYEKQSEESLRKITETADTFYRDSGRYPKDIKELNLFASQRDILLDYSPFSRISLDSEKSVYSISYDVKGTEGGSFIVGSLIECEFK